jgi:hypothetical protein
MDDPGRGACANNSRGPGRVGRAELEVYEYRQASAHDHVETVNVWRDLCSNVINWPIDHLAVLPAANF